MSQQEEDEWLAAIDEYQQSSDRTDMKVGSATSPGVLAGMPVPSVAPPPPPPPPGMAAVSKAGSESSLGTPLGGPRSVRGDSFTSDAESSTPLTFGRRDDEEEQSLLDDALLDLEGDGDADDAHGTDRWLGDGALPPQIHRRSSVGRAPKATDGVTEAVTTLKTFGAHIDNFIRLCDEALLPAEVETDLQAIKELLESVQETLASDVKARDMRNNVEALLEYDKLFWDWENPQVHTFRARAARVAHSQFEYKDWHAPRFLSTQPIAEVKGVVMCNVSFPGADSAHQGTKVDIRPDDRVADVMTRILEKARKAAQRMQTDLGIDSDGDYVLKAKGYNEYMDPRETEHFVFDHEYVRLRLRERLDIHLQLVPRPSPVAAPEDSKEMMERYQKMADPSVKVLFLHEYQNLEAQWETMTLEERLSLTFVPLGAVNLPFGVMIRGLDFLQPEALPRLNPQITSVFVESFVFHGTEILPNGVCSTHAVQYSPSARFGSAFVQTGPAGTTVAYKDIPRAARIAFLVYGLKGVTAGGAEQKDSSKKQERVLLGFVVRQLIDEEGVFSAGDHELPLWPMPKATSGSERKIFEKQEKGNYFIYRATNAVNRTTPETCKLHVRFHTFATDVVAPIVERYTEPGEDEAGAKVPFKKKFLDLNTIENLRKKDIFYEVTQQDKLELWRARHHIVQWPELLPKFLLCVDWSNKLRRMETYRLLKLWAPLRGVDALELLGAEFADYRVREYAVEQLEGVPDDELALYMLQITQILKCEPYHDSPLARFLIKRALANPYQFGHHFFWSLKAELSVVGKDFCERFGCILEEYLSHAGSFAAELRKQNDTVLRLKEVAELIAALKASKRTSKAACKETYVTELKKLNRSFFKRLGSFQTPLDPKLQAKDLIVDRCRFMSSKKVPLLLWMNNADQQAADSPLCVIFKSGDDLRQDILTLQLLRVMDKMWLSEGLDLCMKPYTVMATGVNDEGEGVGMIETVTRSETVADIQWKYGGQQASAAWDDRVITEYLRDFNKTATEYAAAVDRFLRSCAGYCVATYLLGIGDRHSDNYMVREDGVFFHIDFGHFLGNWKYKMGICRERTKFVFTPEMCNVLGGKKSKMYQTFKETCARALNICRKQGRLLENLFLLMVSAGMPELVVHEDVHYLKDRLMLGEKDSTAKKAFEKELKACLADRVRRADNYAHLIKHKGG